MHRPNSSTSNFDKPLIASPRLRSPETSKKIRRVTKTGLCFVASLIALDAGINILFPYPKDPLNTSPGTMNLYFDYGRSLEGKITRQIGPTDEQSAPIARAGWLGDLPHSPQPKQPTAAGHHLIAMYGMSFVGNVGKAMQKTDSSLDMRLILGPAAPPNHSFAAYQRDRHQNQAEVVVFGILASSVKGMDAMSGMTWSTDVPPPFTFSKYVVENQQLREIAPQVQSLDQLRQARQNPQQWQAFVNQLRQNDRFFDDITFDQNWLDHSAIFRMLRRAWTKKHQDQVTQQIHDQNGFNPQWEQATVLKLMVEEFARTAKADQRIPIVILFNDRGYDDHLYQLLKPTLEAAKIPYVSSHSIAPATDGRNFVPDGHFTEAANEKIAEKVLSLVQQELAHTNRK
jgi:hypothetical protein